MAILQSKLFKGDAKLEDTAQFDKDHLGEFFNPKHPSVQKIQEALQTIMGVDLSSEAGQFGPKTGDAVAAFKSSRKPPILNYKGQIDRVVGIKTIKALDSLLPVASGPPPPPAPAATTILDFVVRFRAGSFKTATDNLDLTAYGKKTGRQLVPILRRADIGNAALIQSVIAEIDAALMAPGAKLGIICINGNSAGGRNALELAAALKGKHPVRFLGIADAALFGDLPGMNRPIPATLVPPRVALNVPEWMQAPQSDAVLKHNFFQNSDNRVGGKNPLKLVWSSTNPNGEIHGKLTGFHLNQEISVPLKERFRAHDFAGDAGDARNGATISSLLGSL